MRVMVRRLAALLFSVAMLTAGLAAAPCVGRVACAMTAADRKDCCTQKTGIAAPRCCSGEQRVQRGVSPATPERPAQHHLGAAALHAAPVAAVIAEPAQPACAWRVDTGADPPGGTLIAQHTSLLL
jgi:hypothetical protein